MSIRLREHEVGDRRLLHPLTCSCEVDVVVEKDGGVVDLEVSRSMSNR